MSKTRHKSRRPDSKKHRRIPLETKELCIQLKHMGYKYNDIALRTHLGYSTIEHICNEWANSNPESVKLARAKALEELAGRLTEKAVMAIDSITPDSLTHDRIVHKDKEGNVTGVSHSGPTGQQIAITAGVLLDKVTALEGKAAVLRGEQPLALSPDSFGALLESIKGRITKLTSINANADLSQLSIRVAELGDAQFANSECVVEEDDDSVQEAEYEEL